MTPNEIRAKLTGLYKSFVTTISSSRGERRYWRPSSVIDLCERFVAVRAVLKTQFPALFDDLPMRPVPKSSGTSDHDGEGYIEQRDLDPFLLDAEYCLDVLEAHSTAEVPSLSLDREGIFFAGQVYDAFSRIASLVNVAKKQIRLADGYISQKVLDLFVAKPKGVSVHILTKDVDATLKQAAADFQQQYGGLEIRLSSVFHDRFLIIDDEDFYHFGASLKDAGKRGFMFSRIEENTIIDALRQEFVQAWKNAKHVL